MNSMEIPVADLETLRRGLEAVETFLEARDIADSARMLSPVTQWSPLTTEVTDLVDLVRSYIADFAVAQYEEGREAEAEEELVVDLTTEDDSDDSED